MTTQSVVTSNGECGFTDALDRGAFDASLAPVCLVGCSEGADSGVHSDMPPSTGMIAPVVQLSSRARRAIQIAASSGVPARRRGRVAVRVSRSSFSCASVMPALRKSDVRMGPGAMALTRMPSGPSSRAQHRVSWASAAFEAA